MASRLAGKVAIVTGAASGIGRAIALRFAGEGARVVVADVETVGGEQTAAFIRAAGGAGSFHACDVSDEEQVRALVEHSVREGGRLDVLVNNAGVPGPGRLAGEIELADYRRVLDVVLLGPFLCAKHALPHLLAAGGGAIVNNASMYGLITVPGIAPYATAKAGLIMLTKQLAVDYGHLGIRANCICPGYVDTDLGGRRARMDPEAAAATLAERERRAALQPAGRQAQPDEMAGACVFLASDDASFVNGAILTLDGGATALHNIGTYR